LGSEGKGMLIVLMTVGAGADLWFLRSTALRWLSTLPLHSAAAAVIFLASEHHRSCPLLFFLHIAQLPSSPWASALDRYMFLVLGSRVGWTPARKERTNERYLVNRGICVCEQLI